ncbi:MAG TPA: hypothetical protein VIJ30_04810 [Candidatus Dormibacteraeota bacterium]
MEQRYDGLAYQPNDGGRNGSGYGNVRYHHNSVSKDEYQAVKRGVDCADEPHELVHPPINALLRVPASVESWRGERQEGDGRQ